jgi:hypothetical protein
MVLDGQNVNGGIMGKYFDKTGMAFATPGDYSEVQFNLKSAVDIIRTYIISGGHQAEVEEALQFLEKEFPKCRRFAQELRNVMFTDDLFGYEYKDRLCAYWFNQLISRFS